MEKRATFVAAADRWHDRQKLRENVEDKGKESRNGKQKNRRNPTDCVQTVENLKFKYLSRKMIIKTAGI